MNTEGNGQGESIKAGQTGRSRARRQVSQGPRVFSQEGSAAIGPRLLDLDAAATYLGVSPWTIRDLEAAGTLKRVTIPVGAKDLRKLLFDRTDLDALIDRWKAS